MAVVDAQLHNPAPWLPWDEDDRAVRNLLQTELVLAAMDAVGVDAVLLDPLGDYRWAEYAAQQFPARFGSVRYVDPDAPDLDEQVARLRSRPGGLAVRVLVTSTLSGDNRARFEAGGFDSVFGSCERHEVPAFVFVGGEAGLVESVARAYPGLTLVVDHLAIPQPPVQAADDPPFARLPNLLALAKFPNVAVKVTGAPCLSLEPYPYRDLWPHLHRIVDAFGPERVMWGSDIHRIHGRIGWHVRYPTAYTHSRRHTYAEALGYLLHTEELGPADKEQIVGATIRRLLRWPRPASVS